MSEPIVNTKGSPNIDGQTSELTVAWRLDQMRREIVRSRELIAELRRQIDARNIEIGSLKAELTARASGPSWIRALTSPGIARI